MKCPKCQNEMEEWSPRLHPIGEAWYCQNKECEYYGIKRVKIINEPITKETREGFFGRLMGNR